MSSSLSLLDAFYTSSLLVACLLVGSCGPAQVTVSRPLTTGFAVGQVVDSIDNDIWAIFQDVDGLYWFGSNNTGLYRYDGEQLMVFNVDYGLPSNQIRQIKQHVNGTLLIDTPRGVSKYDGEQFVTLAPVQGGADDWQLTSEDLWFSTNATASDILRYDGDTLYELPLPRQDLYAAMGLEVTTMTFDPYDVFGVAKDANGDLWMGTAAAGAYRYDGESFLWIGDKDLSILNDGRVPGVRSMLQDRNGRYWMSNFTHTYSLDSTGTKPYTKITVNQFTSLPTDGTTHFNGGLVDRSGDLWMTAYSSGVWRYSSNGLERMPIVSTIRDLHVMTIYEDADGVLWLGTQDDGVYKWETDHFKKVKL